MVVAVAAGMIMSVVIVWMGMRVVARMVIVMAVMMSRMGWHF